VRADSTETAGEVIAPEPSGAREADLIDYPKFWKFRSGKGYRPSRLNAFGVRR
jgi:hypothetical protein